MFGLNIITTELIIIMCLFCYLQFQCFRLKCNHSPMSALKGAFYQAAVIAMQEIKLACVERSVIEMQRH